MLVALAAAGSLACAATTLRITIDKDAKATLKLGDGNQLTLTGPAELHFRCRTWGDSYFQVLDWTCSGGQLSPQGAQLGASIVEAAVRAALASTGVGAGGAAAGLLTDRLRGVTPIADTPHAP